MDTHVVVSSPGPVEAAILGELGGAFESVRRTIGGVVLRSLEGGQGEPVLLLHDRAHAAPMWLPLLAPLAKFRRVIAVDLPGLGHSSSPPFSGDDPKAAMRFFAEPVAAFVQKLGLERAAIVGHSLGGLVALELALGGQVKPTKLALIASMGLGPAMSLAARLSQRARPETLASLLGAKLFAKARASSLPPRLAALEAELVSMRGGKAPPARAYEALVPLAGPVYGRSFELERVEAETLLLWGERDWIVAPEIALAAAARMPRATCVIEPRLGHAPHLEDAARVAPKLVSFLA